MIYELFLFWTKFLVTADGMLHLQMDLKVILFGRSAQGDSLSEACLR